MIQQEHEEVEVNKEYINREILIDRCWPKECEDCCFKAGCYLYTKTEVGT